MLPSTTSPSLRGLEATAQLRPWGQLRVRFRLTFAPSTGSSYVKTAQWPRSVAALTRNTSSAH
jgi:hypothetical protein